MMVESSDSRPHRSIKLFICFSTSRLSSSSSSSMKLSSKSLLSPSRNRDQSIPQISLSSLSRRLKTSGSIKGGGACASPMFPSGSGTSKKRNGFENNPEPSSPKVTCIGQVRVKTMKQGKKMRMISSRSKRSRSGSGCGSEASFRKAEQHEGFNQGLHFPMMSSSRSQRECLRQRNSNKQRWVHIPLTICEALRDFGSEFNCLVPNKSWCLGSERRRAEEEKARSEGSCGAVFARWFVALGDGNKRRQVEMVVGGDDEEEEQARMSCDSRSIKRQVFQGIDFKQEMLGEALMREDEEGRVSVCVPPKNALLLMRCRSDPVKMAAMGNRFWEMPAAPDEEESEGEYEDACLFLERMKKPLDEKEKRQSGLLPTEVKPIEEDQGMCEKWVCESEGEAAEESNADMDEDKHITQDTGEQCVEESMNEAALVVLDEEDELDYSLAQLFADPEMYDAEANQESEDDVMEEVELPISDPVLEKLEEKQESETETEAELTEESTRSTTIEEEQGNQVLTVTRPETEPKAQTDFRPRRSSQNPVLPDCLLLMMCEPKLSMEVSKETWVCSTDFIRCLPERHVSKKFGKDEAKKPPRVSLDLKVLKPAAAAAQQQVVMQPPRSSCSFPVSMAEIIGQKLVGSTGYEPFVLTRCKSEPMRSAAKLAAPEACFWNNRKMEPHRQPGRLGVGATGVGF